MHPTAIKYLTSPDIQITNISWERLFLEMDIHSGISEPLEFSIARIELDMSSIKYGADYAGDQTNISATLREEYPLIPDAVTDNTYSFRLNMSIISNSSFLNNGRWYFMTRLPGEPRIVIVSITPEASYALRDLDRIFPYGRGKYSYNVHFVPITFDSVNIVPVLNSRFMIENDGWENAYAVKDRKTPKGKCRCMLNNVKMSMMQKTYDILERMHKKDGSHVLLMSETKPYLWGNLKYIDDRIKERHLEDKIHVDYAFRVAVGKKNSAKSWFDTIRLLAKQDFVFVDDFVPIFSFLDLSDRTKLIQVWHAGEGFKSVGYARFGSPNSVHPTENCHRKYDYAITGSRRLASVYSEVFGLPEEKVLPLGMARLDGFLDEDMIASKTDSFYSEHPECQGRKLILFCPTFRGSNQRAAHYNYEMLDLDAIYEFCGDEYVWAFKMHPFVHNKPVIPEKYADRIIDLTANQNINDLYYVTDIMITDYSSAYYEYSILKRPVLFYTYDRAVYEVVRGVHKGIKETAPGKVCDTFEELMNALRAGDYELDKTIRFSEENFGEYDGKAADRIIDTILLS